MSLTPPSVSTPLMSVSEEQLRTWVQGRLTEDRFLHSLGSQQKASELAEQFELSSAERQKVSIAALLHDCAKQMPPKELLEACETLEIPLTENEHQSIQVIHALLGAELVRLEFGIEDTNILNAIRYHTTGRPDMSIVEKVVYIADKIEGNTRNPLYTQKITALLNYRDKATLDQAMLFILDSTMTFLVEKRQLIHPWTVEARNDLIRRHKAATQTLPTLKAHNHKETPV